MTKHVTRLKKVFNADSRFLWLATHDFYKSMNDVDYLKRFYKAMMGKELNLTPPVTYNEKLQWIKLYDHNPLYNTIVDKYEVKNYVAGITGGKYIVPTYGVYDYFDEIDFDSFPDQFVLKCTHDSGGLVICKDKKFFDKSAAKKKIEKCLKRNYYWVGREWPYYDLKPRIIAEKYIEDREGHLVDYKFFCFNGIADNVMVVTERETGDPKFYHFTKEWNLLPYNRMGRRMGPDFKLPKPDIIDSMFEIAEQLSKPFTEVRVDLYDVDGEIYFGEFTLFNESGWESGFDYPSDKHMGDLIILPQIDT